jgi:hypothetical protein
MTMTQITLRNSDGATWTSGSRGKPPKWVSEHPDYIAFKATKSLEVASDTLEVPKTESGLRYWKFIGLNTEEDEVKTAPRVYCYVAASNRVEAMRELNKCFKYPVSTIEMDKMWAEIKNNEFLSKTVGVFEQKGESWIKR